METGKCKIRKNVSKKINQLNFGRGKKFEYQYITNNRIRIFKKGIQLIMDEKDFSLRLAQLREKKGVSARDMSLSMGQNPGYINNIESGKSMPSLTGIFYICDYLGITPSEFFDIEVQNPNKLNEIIANLKCLDDRQLEAIALLLRDILK